MKRTILTTALAIVGCTMALAEDEVERPDTYNYISGVEEYADENYEEAIQCFRRDIKYNPENEGYDNCWLAYAYMHEKETGLAISAANVAVEKLPTKDKEYRSSAYNIRAKVYLQLEDTTAALKDYEQAIALRPDANSNYDDRAQLYYEMGRYDEADHDYDMMIQLDEGDVYGYIGKGRNLNMQKRYDEAIKIFDYVVKLDATYSGGYSFRAEAYYELGQYSKALDDVMMGLAINGADKAFYLMMKLADVAYAETIAKLKVMSIKQPNDAYWDYCMGIVNETTKAYQKAIVAYKSAFEKEANSLTARRMSNCYDLLGNTDMAIEYIDIAAELDSTDLRYPCWKSELYFAKGDTHEAINTLNKIIETDPEFYYAYQERGSCRELMRDYEGALEDYTIALSFDSQSPYATFHRGMVYKALGQAEKAKADFEKSIALDTGEEFASTYFCYLYLGNTDKAIELLNKDLASDADESTHYNATCVYSLMGNQKKALEHLRKALEMGYTKFAHLRLNPDLDNIRETSEYKDMVAEYEARYNAKIAEYNAQDS